MKKFMKVVLGAFRSAQQRTAAFLYTSINPDCGCGACSMCKEELDLFRHKTREWEDEVKFLRAELKTRSDENEKLRACVTGLEQEVEGGVKIYLSADGTGGYVIQDDDEEADSYGVIVRITRKPDVYYPDEVN